MEITEEQRKEWQKKYGEGNLRELTAGGQSVFIFDPSGDLTKMRAIIGARQKGVGAMVDTILANCWVGGDENLKKDEEFKQGIEDQLDEMIDLPEPVIEELENGNLLLSVEGASLEVKKGERMDVKYAEDRNPDRKPLTTSVYLLERIAVDKKALDSLRNNGRAYIGILMSADKLKAKKYVEVKKF
jgi:hypothetical protein